MSATPSYHESGVYRDTLRDLGLLFSITFRIILVDFFAPINLMVVGFFFFVNIWFLLLLSIGFVGLSVFLLP